MEKQHNTESIDYIITALDYLGERLIVTNQQLYRIADALESIANSAMYSRNEEQTDEMRKDTEKWLKKQNRNDKENQTL